MTKEVEEMIKWLKGLNQNNQTKFYELEHAEVTDLILFVESQERIIKSQTKLGGNDMYILKRDGKELFRGTENECYFKLQKIQPQSHAWAIKWEGYSVEPA